MEYRRIIAALLLSSLAFAAACDDDDEGNNPPQQFANVRVVNASSGNASVNLLNGTTVLTAAPVAFGSQSAACVRVPLGTSSLTFQSAGGTGSVATVTAPTGGFTNEGNYTVVLFGGTTPSAQVFSDLVTNPATGNNGVRFVNATQTAGRVYVTAPNATINSNTTADITNLGVAGVSSFGTGTSASPFGTFTTDRTQVRLFDANATTFNNPRVNVTLGSGSNLLNSNRVGTVVFTQPATGSQTALVSTPCS